MKYRLGRKRSAPDYRTLYFANYLRPEAALPRPASVDYFSKVKSWPMYGNDILGDCTIAALGHFQNSEDVYAQGVQGGPTTAQVESVYKVLSPDDSGCDMLSTLKYMTKTGMGGQKIAAYVAIETTNRPQVETAIALFGNLYIGLELPDAIVNAADPFTIPWSVPSSGAIGAWAPNPNLGHAIAGVGYRPSLYPQNKNVINIVTWGRCITFGWSAYCAYADEVYAIITNQWIERNGLSPSGFNLAQLLADRASVAALPPN